MTLDIGERKLVWTDEELHELRMLFTQGASDLDIAKKMGRTLASVANKRYGIGLRVTRERRGLWSEEDLQRAREMYATGFSRQIIAAQIGRSIIAVKRLITEKSLTRDAGARVPASFFDVPGENWREYPSFPLLGISSLGSVRYLYAPIGGAIAKQEVKETGHRRVAVQIGVTTMHFSVHRMVCEAFNGPEPVGLPIVRHRDGDPGNNTPGNVAWSTYQENSLDRWAHDTMVGFRGTGTGSARAKLSDDEVEFLRGLGISSKAERQSLSSALGVSESTIYHIQTARTWKEPSAKTVVKHRENGGFVTLRRTA